MGQRDRHNGKVYDMSSFHQGMKTHAARANKLREFTVDAFQQAWPTVSELKKMTMN